MLLNWSCGAYPGPTDIYIYMYIYTYRLGRRVLFSFEGSAYEIFGMEAGF